MPNVDADSLAIPAGAGDLQYGVAALRDLVLQNDLTEEQVVQLLSGLDDSQLQSVRYDWNFWARPEQLPPPDGDKPWEVWLIKSGRGWGKGATGANYITDRAKQGKGPITLIGQTVGDVRSTMINGISGILHFSSPDFYPLYEPSKRTLTWPNRVVGTTYSGDSPDQLRGANSQSAWIDELCIIGNSEVSTSRGLVPICEIRAGDMVWTREGLRRVLRSWCTSPAAEVYEIVDEHGRRIVGTAGHPVWVEKKGFVPLQSIQIGDTLIVNQSVEGGSKWQERASIQLLNGAGKNGISASGAITKTGATARCTERFIERRTERYPQDTISTTKTIIPPTTPWKTWSALPPRNTWRDTRRADFWCTMQKLAESLSLSGGKTKSPCNSSVPNAKSLFTQSGMEQFGALGDASNNSLETLVASLRSGNARGAEEPIAGVCIKRQSSAPGHVVMLPAAPRKYPVLFAESRSGQEIKPSGPAATPVVLGTSRCVQGARLLDERMAVYNIEVEDCHEYFANGILGKNCKFQYPDRCWEEFELGFRIGDPRCIVTTTPRPIKIIKQLEKDPGTYLVQRPTYDNIANLSPAYIRRIIRRYEGTRLAAQELYGITLDEFPGALWNPTLLEDCRVKTCPPLRSIVVAIDPAEAIDNRFKNQSSVQGEESDLAEVGIVAAGLGDHDGHVYIIADATGFLSPGEWAARAVGLYKSLGANVIVAERNKGGKMVEHTIHTEDDRVPVKLVWASQGKDVRAEPVAALYEQRRVHHVGMFGDLESQMCSFVPHDQIKTRLDRMDAMVYAVTHLLLYDEEMPHLPGARVRRWRRP